MKKGVTLFFVVVLTCILAACLEPQPDNTVTIHGTVTITRNGISWNTDNFPTQSVKEYIDNEMSLAARDIPPQSPWIWAYTISETGDRVHIGTAYIDDYNYYMAPANSATYKWSMRIPPDTLPGLIYFKVSGEMIEAVYSFSSSDYTAQMTEGIWVNNEDETIDLGIIDFKILKLSGNLPVTINGDPPDYNYNWVRMNVYRLETFTRIGVINISPNGDWSFYFFPTRFPLTLSFEVEIIKGIMADNISRYSYFKEELYTDNIITLYDADKEVLLPSVDFKAFNISGTIKFIASKEPLSWYDIHFYEKEVPYYTAWNYEIASIVEWDPQPDGNGIIQWEIVVPAFSFPHNLPFWIRATAGDIHRSNLASSSVLITSEADLNNIYLGSFNVE